MILVLEVSSPPHTHTNTRARARTPVCASRARDPASACLKDPDFAVAQLDPNTPNIRALSCGGMAGRGGVLKLSKLEWASEENRRGSRRG